MRDPSGMAACVKTVFIVHPVSEDVTDYEPMCLVWGLDPVIITARAPDWGAPIPFAPSDLGKIDPGGGSFSPRQIAQLGHACEIVDCTSVSLYMSPVSRSFTLGHSIWLSSRDKCRVAGISHELFHVFQFNVFGAGEYLRRGISDRLQERTGDPYQNSLADRNSLEPIPQHIEDNLTSAGAGRLVGCS